MTGLTKIKATETVETLLEIIKSSLADGENVLVSGFGKFCVKAKQKRKGRNPATGEEMMLDEPPCGDIQMFGKIAGKNQLNRSALITAVFRPGKRCMKGILVRWLLLAVAIFTAALPD